MFKERTLLVLMAGMLGFLLLTVATGAQAQPGRGIHSSLESIGSEYVDFHRQSDGSMLQRRVERFRQKGTGLIFERSHQVPRTLGSIGQRARQVLFPRTPAGWAVAGALLAAGYFINDAEEEVQKVPDFPLIKDQTAGGNCYAAGNGWYTGPRNLADCEALIANLWGPPANVYTKTNWVDGLACTIPGDGTCLITQVQSPGSYGHVRVYVNSNQQLRGFWRQGLLTPDDGGRVFDEMEEPINLTDEQIGEAIAKNGAYKGLMRELFTDRRTGAPIPGLDPLGDDLRDDFGSDLTDYLNGDPIAPNYHPQDSGMDGATGMAPDGGPIPDSAIPKIRGSYSDALSGSNPGTNRDTGHYDSVDTLTRDATDAAPRDGFEGDPVPEVTGDGPSSSSDSIPQTDDGTGSGSAVKVRLSCEGLNVLACVSMGSDDYIGSTELPVDWLPVVFTDSQVCPNLSAVPGIDWSDFEETLCGGFEAARPVILLIGALVAALIMSVGIMRA